MNNKTRNKKRSKNFKTLLKATTSNNEKKKKKKTIKRKKSNTAKFFFDQYNIQYCFDNIPSLG